jgi:hypothetical protein
MQQLSKQPAFELGQIVATPGALAALKKAGQQPGEFLTRHVNREWGDVPDENGERTSTCWWSTSSTATREKRART